MVESSPVGGKNWSAEILEIESLGFVERCLQDIVTNTRNGRPLRSSVSSHRSSGIQRINGARDEMRYHNSLRALSLKARQVIERESSVVLSQ